MLYYRQVPNLSQTNLNEIYASQTASIERGGHPDMEFLQLWSHNRSGMHLSLFVWSSITRDSPDGSGWSLRGNPTSLKEKRNY